MGNRWLWTAMLLLGTTASAGCDDGSGSSGTGGDGGSGATTTTTGTTQSSGGGGTGGEMTGGGGDGGSVTPVCAPGAKESCYDGPDGTNGVGTCKGGERTCLEDGSGYGPCEGQIVPVDEVCSDAADEDCDGTANEADAGCACVPGADADCYEGPDGTLGKGLCVAGKHTCEPDGLGFGPCTGQVLPAEETCATPGDDDCDGETNEGGPGCTCVPGSVSSCYSGPAATEDVGPCKGGEQTCNEQGTGFGPCVGEVLPVDETCNTTIDDDCDGQTNESGAGCVCPPNQNVPCYTGPAGTQNVGACKGGQALCNAQGTMLGACTGQTLPATETCNTTVDDDCDGQTNESGPGCVCLPNSVAACYTGPAGTQNVGICTGGTQTCNAQGTAYGPCMGQVTPGTESCATPGDEDCDGQSNEGCGGGVSYAASVQPIFANRCSPCHTGGGSGSHNIGISYADTQLPSYYCSGLTKGACALVRIQDMSMPAGNPGSVPAGEQATIQAWIAGGQQP